MKATIVGGGIAGLTTAIALNKIGIQTEIFEAAPEIKPVGAGLALSANAIKALQKIGIADTIIPYGRLLPYFSIHDKKGKVISMVDSVAISRKFGMHNFMIHRADLHRALLEQLNTRTVHTSKKAINMKRDGRCIHISFADGTVHETEMLIIADGINSVLRRKVIPDAAIRYSGYTCWRGLLTDPGISISGPAETWAPEGRFGIAPLAQNKIYWYACINAAANDASFRNFSIEDLHQYFKDFHNPIPQVLAGTSSETLIQNDIYDLEPLSRYACGNIVLVGDAAHATTPNMGQGACQAIEDAAILADELQKNGDFTEAFRHYEKRRLRRTHYIIRQSRKIGEIAQIKNPVLAFLRNTAIRLTPAFIQEKQYSKVYETDF
ncbi:MAG TPA: FAD-dependent monooxygenase [Sphingobacteriaceae bacterium]